MSSQASLSPALARVKGDSQPASPVRTLHPTRGHRRAVSLRAHFRPTQPSVSLGLQTHTATTMLAASRPTSPRPTTARDSRSPTRPDLIPRPSSRCETLLRDTLRRDEHGRIQQRSASRSPSRWSDRPVMRPRGSSFLGTLSGSEDLSDDGKRGDGVDAFVPNGRGSYDFVYRPQHLAAPRAVRGASTTRAPEAMLSPYGSPSSPTPLPPFMQRTRTAPPAVPRTSRPSFSEEQRNPALRSTQSARPANINQTNGGTSSASQSRSSSNETSPKLRPHALSPHEAVLRAKLECVLMKTGAPAMDEKAAFNPQLAGRMRNHQRSQTHGVTVVTARKTDEPSSSSVSPKVRHPSFVRLQPCVADRMSE